MPVCAERRKLAAFSLRERKSNKLRGFIPQTQLFAATAAMPNYNTFSRAMATEAVRWPYNLGRMGYFGDQMALQAVVLMASQAVADLNAIFGSDLKVEKSGRANKFEF